MKEIGKMEKIEKIWKTLEKWAKLGKNWGKLKKKWNIFEINRWKK